ncbi:AraC family transcriptional regulator [Archangium lipolyticum]|uniref:AraC family transcriptional regulator n=1 Tax=Archangium lipolyticum TaxID=2970465 RepID=UPI00214A15ED|nr:AraC family transcriptional regulator [Archangium lipolyticum]
MPRVRRTAPTRQPGPVPAGPTTWAGLVPRVLDSAEARGLPRSGLLKASGLERVRLTEPEARVPLLSVYTLLEEAAVRLGDGCFGLHVGAALRADDLDALGFLMVSSRTFGEALEHALRYQRLWSEGERFALERGAARVTVTYHPYGSERPAHRLMAQLVFADLLVNGGRLVGGLPGARLRLRGPRPGEAPAYMRVLGVPVSFRAPQDALVFPVALLARPLPGGDAGLSGVLARATDRMLAGLPASSRAADRVRALLPELLPESGAELAHLAAHLGMSPRTLQRRLRDEGTSLEAEREAFRRQQARVLLEAGTPIAEVAWRLGYSAPSAFHHAFRRWTGQSPRAWCME